jgi:hypothetical protein
MTHYFTNRTAEGSNIEGNSSFVFVQTSEAMILPLEAPEMILGSN